MPRGRPRKHVMVDINRAVESEIEERQVNNELNQQADEEAADAEQVEPKRPRYVDPEWHSFVMSQFVPEELDNHGNPKVDGLRRVAEGLLGEIVESRPVQSSSAPDLAAVNWLLVIAWACDNPYVDIGSSTPLQNRTFGAFADASLVNCKPPYNKFLASMSDTRAEAKCLRRALRLRCIASEEAEMGETNTFDEKVSDGSYKGDALINDQQAMMINVISQRLDISVDKLVEKTFPGKTIKNITKENAANIIVLLNKFQSSVKEGSESVPEDLKI
jgi:hypothetical protein